MIKGLYTAASGMLSSMIATDALANNLANASTVGFKRSDVHFKAFPEMLLQRINAKGAAPIGGISTGTQIAGTMTRFTQGDLHTTGNPLDVAIEGNGFFTVQNGKGETLYTRDGNFTLNNEGYLVTHEGEFVMGKKGKIRIPSGEAIHFTPRGDVTGNNVPLDNLVITQFDNEHTLQRLGNNLFKMGAGTKITPPPQDPKQLTFKLHEGKLESSNTNAIHELVNTITGFRLYESLQKNIQIHNETLGKAVNDVGRA
jgi:flagellar basal-body rod protein FlgG